MTIGTVKWFNATKGFGFISPEDGSKDAFVHISAVQQASLPGLSEGQRVEFELQTGQNGKTSAENLTLVDEPSRSTCPTLSATACGSVGWAPFCRRSKRRGDRS